MTYSVALMLFYSYRSEWKIGILSIDDEGDDDDK